MHRKIEHTWVWAYESYCIPIGPCRPCLDILIDHITKRVIIGDSSNIVDKKFFTPLCDLMDCWILRHAKGNVRYFLPF